MGMSVEQTLTERKVKDLQVGDAFVMASGHNYIHGALVTGTKQISFNHTQVTILVQDVTHEDVKEVTDTVESDLTLQVIS